MTKEASLVLVMVLTMVCAHSVDCSRLLMLPSPSKSHIMYFNNLASELIERGHKVYIVLPLINATATHLIDLNGLNPQMQILTYEHINLESKVAEMKDTMDRIHFEGGIMSTINGLRFISTLALENCRYSLSDGRLFRSLQNLKLDMAVVDGFNLFRCQFIFPYKLEIPYVVLSTFYEPLYLRVPALPSVTPVQLFPFTEEMTFLQRLINTLGTLALYTMPGMKSIDDNLVREFAPARPFKTLYRLLEESELWMINYDTLLEYRRPSMPNVIPVGGLTTKPAKKLSPELLSIVDKAPDGIIVVSFGSILDNVPVNFNNKLMSAFGKISRTIIWKYIGEGSDKDVPSNVFLRKWLPQNDILAHPKTHLFITHCGNNGQFEALYHGVPMLGFPVFGDQPYNAKRMEYKGYGIVMDIGALTEEELVSNINLILSSNKYKNNIKKASQIFRSRPDTPRERAGDWTEHVLKYGGQHLRSYASSMRLYEYIMADILLVLISILIIFLASTFIVIRHFLYGKARVDG